VVSCICIDCLHTVYTLPFGSPCRQFFYTRVLSVFSVRSFGCYRHYGRCLVPTHRVLDSAYKPAASYAAPAYKGAGYSNGRAKIQVYRGTSKGYVGGKGRLLEVNVRSARPFALIWLDVVTFILLLLLAYLLLCFSFFSCINKLFLLWFIDSP
jgi:hypothetical protein